MNLLEICATCGTGESRRPHSGSSWGLRGGSIPVSKPGRCCGNPAAQLLCCLQTSFRNQNCLLSVLMVFQNHPWQTQFSFWAATKPGINPGFSTFDLGISFYQKATIFLPGEIYLTCATFSYIQINKPLKESSGPLKKCVCTIEKRCIYCRKGQTKQHEVLLLFSAFLLFRSSYPAIYWRQKHKCPFILITAGILPHTWDSSQKAEITLTETNHKTQVS